jgi:hypothetical protein
MQNREGNDYVSYQKGENYHEYENYEIELE